MLINPIDDRTASLYDLSVLDWPSEIDFYKSLVESINQTDKSVLEIGCGTGRVSIKLAGHAAHIVGVDISAPMLEIARKKSTEWTHFRWELADMKAFDLGLKFELVILPGHSFQFMLTPTDQLACLDCIKTHLDPHGLAVVHVDHQDISWLGCLRSGKGGVFEPAGEVFDPATGRRIRTFKAWTYEPVSQTATCLTRREEFNEEGQIVDQWETGPALRWWRCMAISI